MLKIERKPEGRRTFGLIETPSHRYTFPVRCDRQRFATMSAVDEGGSTVIRYREVPGRRHLLESVREMEIVISPEQPISDELCCILWASRGFLWFYFNYNYPH